VTGDTALRLSAALGTTAEFWLNLQNVWEMNVARREWKTGVDRVGRGKH
jgi:addiction module HigA family antidote